MKYYNKILFIILNFSLFISTIFLFSQLNSSLEAQFLDNFSTDTSSIPLDDNTNDKMDKQIKVAGVVKSISAEIISDELNTVKISWIPSSEKGEYIVARSSVPISNISILLAADSIGIYPSSESFAMDSGLSPGTYYYAVVLRKYIKKKSVVLIAGSNYTTKPVIFKTKKNSPENNIPPPVSMITPSRIKKRVIRITWQGSNLPNIFYNVYRSAYRIDSKAALLKAIKVIQIKNGAQYYIDESLPYDGKYYYAVTTSFENGKENLKLTPKQTYTVSPIIIDSENSQDVSTYIKAYLLSGKKIGLKWKAAKNNLVKAYKIYRYSEVINSIVKLKKAELLTSVQKNIHKYVDVSPLAGTNYYALVSVFQDGQESKVLISNSNFTNQPVYISPEGKNNIKLISISALKSSSGVVEINWEYSGFASDNINLHLYRTTELPFDYSSLDEDSLIATVPISDKSYSDTVDEEGSYYYAALIYQGNNRLQGKYSADRNYTSEAIDISFNSESANENYNEDGSYEAKINAMKEVKFIIINYYRKNMYTFAIKKLRKIAENSSYNHKTRSLALLYMGMSYYYLGKKKKALKYFIHKGVRKYFPTRSNFWYKKTLEGYKP